MSQQIVIIFPNSAFTLNIISSVHSEQKNGDKQDESVVSATRQRAGTQGVGVLVGGASIR